MWNSAILREEEIWEYLRYGNDLYIYSYLYPIQVKVVELECSLHIITWVLELITMSMSFSGKSKRPRDNFDLPSRLSYNCQHNTTPQMLGNTDSHATNSSIASSNYA